MQAPPLDGLQDAAAEAEAFFARVDAARDGGYVNHEGGDVGGHGSTRLLLRHTANYLAAVRLAEQAGVQGALVDVGSGVGALGAWAAERLGLQLHLVDHDPDVRAVAAAAFPHALVAASLGDVPSGCAGLVTAMEVIEHIPPEEQESFVAELIRLLRPGGLLVLSTPDESRYLGGSSGYAPHIGCLDAEELHEVVSSVAEAAHVAVWRLDGKPFELGPVRRVVEPLVNRAWAAVSHVAPPLVGALARAVALLPLRSPTAALDAFVVRALPPAHGTGTGLLAVVRA